MEITRGKIDSPQKTVIYGPEGIGKSTLASKFPNPVFIDTEGSTKKLDVARTKRPSSFAMLLEQVKSFKFNQMGFKTLVLDTADWAEMLCIAELCSKYNKDGIEGFGYGKGYVYLAEEFGRLLNLLEDLTEIGMNVVIVAHAAMRKFEQPDEMGSYDRWELKLQKKTAPLLKEWADMVLFANYKTYVINVDGQGADKGKNKVQGGHRVMYTSHHPCWDAKNRHDLPSEINMDYSEIKHCIEIVPKAAAQFTPNTATVITNTPTPKEPKQKVIDEGIFEPVSEKESKEIEAMFNKNKTETPATEMKPTIDTENAPKKLADLMIANNVTGKEIRTAVSKRGYYPLDTPIANYDPNFIEGVLVGAWGPMFDFIKQIRKGEM